MKRQKTLNIKSIITAAAALLVTVFGTAILFTSPAAAATLDCSGATANKVKCEACKGAGGETFNDATGQCDAGAAGDTQTKVTDTVNMVITIFSWVVGVASVIMIIVGGFKYVTSSGDANNITSAKNTILYAIIGLVVVSMAQIIVRFVINKV